MSKKQSSVEWLFVELLNTPKDKFEWQSIFEQAKAMHKEEIVNAVSKGWNYYEDGFFNCMGKYYYNRTFKEQE